MNPAGHDSYSVDDQPSGIFSALDDDDDTEGDVDGDYIDGEEGEVTTQMLTINPNLQCNTGSSFDCFNIPMQESRQNKKEKK